MGKLETVSLCCASGGGMEILFRVAMAKWAIFKRSVRGRAKLLARRKKAWVRRCTKACNFRPLIRGGRLGGPTPPVRSNEPLRTLCKGRTGRGWGLHGSRGRFILKNGWGALVTKKAPCPSPCTMGWACGPVGPPPAVGAGRGCCCGGLGRGRGLWQVGRPWSQPRRSTRTSAGLPWEFWGRGFAWEFGGGMRIE